MHGRQVLGGEKVHAVVQSSVMCGAARPSTVPIQVYVKYNIKTAPVRIHKIC